MQNEGGRSRRELTRNAGIVRAEEECLAIVRLTLADLPSLGATFAYYATAAVRPC